MAETDMAERFVALQHACNLRDLGGHRTADDRVVKSGLIFRAASLHALSEAHLATFDMLGIARVVDLRTTRERALQPSRISAPTWTRDYGHSGADLSQTWRRPDLDSTHSKALMQDAYRVMLDEQAQAYAVLFQRIADGELPLLFHCTAGKDRTGVGAALLLEVLGVPRVVIEADYMRTAAMLKRSLDEVRASLLRIGLPPMTDDVLAPILGVSTDYLDTMFQTLDDRYGSAIAYLDRRLGIGADTVAAIRDALLEDCAA